MKKEKKIQKKKKRKGEEEFKKKEIKINDMHYENLKKLDNEIMKFGKENEKIIKLEEF